MPAPVPGARAASLPPCCSCNLSQLQLWHTTPLSLLPLQPQSPATPPVPNATAAAATPPVTSAAAACHHPSSPAAASVAAAMCVLPRPDRHLNMLPQPLPHTAASPPQVLLQLPTSLLQPAAPAAFSRLPQPQPHIAAAAAVRAPGACNLSRQRQSLPHTAAGALMHAGRTQRSEPPLSEPLSAPTPGALRQRGAQSPPAAFTRSTS